MAVRQHEAVAVQPGRIARVELENIAPKDFGDVRQAHGRAWMARIGLLDGIHGKGTNSVGEVAAGRHDEVLYLKCDGRQAAYCPRCAPRQQPSGMSVGRSALCCRTRRKPGYTSRIG